MLLLHDAVTFGLPLDNHPLVCKLLQFDGTYPITEHEYKTLDYAFTLFEKALVQDNMVDTTQRATVFFTQDGTLKLSFALENTIGIYRSIIVLAIDRWRSREFNGFQIMVAVLEELCHCFWQIYDEATVEQKVASIVQIGFPHLSLDTLYSGYKVEAYDSKTPQ